MRKSSLAAALLALSASGCMVGPDYVRPTIETPAAWDQAAAGSTAAGVAFSLILRISMAFVAWSASIAGGLVSCWGTGWVCWFIVVPPLL